MEREVLEAAAPAVTARKKAEAPRVRKPGPAVAEDRSGQKPNRFPFTREVRAGENLYRMILEVYGASNPELWDLVRKRNSRIKEDLKIRVGEKIIFPEWKSMAKNGEQ
jgi:hypothetical protein